MVEIELAKPEHIDQIRKMELSMWKREGYPFYRALHGLYPNGIVAAVDSGKVLGFVAAERINTSKLLQRVRPNTFQKHVEVPEGRGSVLNIPAYAHHPRDWHDPKGDALYILNLNITAEGRKAGVTAPQLLARLKEEARHQGVNKIWVVYKFQHRYMKTLDAAKGFWEHTLGFKMLPETLEPLFTSVKGQPPTGGIIFEHKL